MKPIRYIAIKETEKEKIEVYISLDDDCNNGHCDFSVTCRGREKNAYGVWEDSFGGAAHEEVLRFFPEFADFVALHLANSYGQPMYAVENGHYILTTKGAKEAADYLRITEAEAATLSGEKEMFKYQLFQRGIVENWKKEAEAAIRHLETLCGQKFEDYENPKALILTDEEKAEIEQREKSGYYTEEAAKQREEAAKEAKKAELLEAAQRRYKKIVKEATQSYDVDKVLIELFGTTDNVIVYHHRDEIAFNWRNFGKKWTKEEIALFDESNPLSGFMVVDNEGK